MVSKVSFSSLLLVGMIAPMLVTSSETVGSGSKDDRIFIEPDVRVYSNVLPKEACEKIIELGEANGFLLQYEDIDDTVTQDIDVMNQDGTVAQVEIFTLIEPYIANITKHIQSQRDDYLDQLVFPEAGPNRAPKLSSIFYRKYAPGSARNSLIPHHDGNMHTVNIAINDDFKGGGLFYVRPTYEENPEWMDETDNHNNGEDENDGEDQDLEDIFYKGERGNDIPELHNYQYTYDWVNTLKHENTTDGVVFPVLQTGDALIHNYTVLHAVAPIEEGVRYSMVLFYDMDNPLTTDDDEPEFAYDDDDDFYQDYKFQFLEEDDEDYEDDNLDPIVLSHDIRECDPDTKTAVPIQDPIDVVWINPFEDDNEEMKFLKTLQPGETMELRSQAGHFFKAVKSVPKGSEPIPLESREVMGWAVVQPMKTNYRFISRFQQPGDCGGTNPFNEEDANETDDDDDDDDDDDNDNNNDYEPIMDEL